MATVKGVWVWNETLSATSESFDEMVNFVSNGVSYTSMQFEYGPFTGSVALHYVGFSGGITVYYGDIDEWGTPNVPAHRTIDFGDTEQTVSDDFYAYLTANAVQQVTNMEIPLTHPDGVTLATVGKYCDKNIKVMPVLQEKLATLDGRVVTPDAGYAGLSKVTVNLEDAYVIPNGVLGVNANGIYDVHTYAHAEVNVPIPDGYVIPTGSVSITANGTHDVTGKSSAVVNVPQGVFTTPLTVTASDVQTSCDGFWVMGTCMASELAKDYLNSVDNMVVDHDGICPCIAFYGWTNTGSDNIVAFGYEINGVQVWDDSKIQSYGVSDGAGGTVYLTGDNTVNNISPDIGLSTYFPYAKRHFIEVKLSGLAAGLYNITPLIKTTNEILGLNSWGTIKYVKWV